MNAHMRTLVVSAAAVVSLARPDSAFACSCIQPLPAASNSAFNPTVEYRQWFAGFNGVVFRGTVLSVESALRDQARTQLSVAGAMAALRVTFRVERVWKGVTTSEIAIYTAENDGLCGIKFAVGTSYLVAAGPPELPTTGTCSEGYFYTRSEATLVDVLGQGSPPAK
jgi:hypothetical protein